MSRIVCVCVVFSILVAGCAEGPFWQTGRLSPWVREQWAAEEAVADTYFKTKRDMTEKVVKAQAGSARDRDLAARELGEKALNDPILLNRLQAIRLLAQLDSPESYQALRRLNADPNSDVRLAIVQAWKKMPADQAVPALQQTLGSDTSVDVRLAATRALGEIPGDASTRALRQALADRDPAIQLRATESLAKVTGQSIGRDVTAWQQFLAQTLGDEPAQQTAGRDPNLR